MTLKSLAAGAVLAAVALASPPASADCVDGVRKATAKEAEHFARVFAALKESLPPAPPDWTLAPAGTQSMTSLCTGTREGDFPVDVRARYTYRMPKDQADRNQAEARKVQADLDALEKLPPETAKERQTWMDRYSEATRAARQADKDGNKDLAKQKYAERAEYDRQASAVRERHQESIKPKVAPLRARLAELSSAPVDVTLRVTANDRFPDRLDPQRESEIVLGAVPAPKAPGLKVHGIRVLAQGPSPRREELIGLVDRARLEGLLR